MATPTTTPAPPGRTGAVGVLGRRPGLVLAALVAGTVALRLPAVLATRHLTFDDAVYGASALAMREGALPFREVFSSQGPLWLPLVYAADLLGLRTADAPRLVNLAAGVVLVLAVLAAARRVADRDGAVLAAVLTALTGSVLWVTGQLAADGPTLALATVAVAFALAYRDEPSAGKAAAAGVAVGAALSIKALVIGVAAPVGLLLLAARRPRHLVLAVGASAALALVLALPWGLGDVWDQSIDYHTDAATDRTPIANLRKVSSTIGDRDAPVLVAGVLAGGAALLAGRRRRPRGDAAPPGPSWWRLTQGMAPVVAWLLAGVAVLAWEYPMWRPHVSYLVPPAVLLIARWRPPWVVLGLAALVVLPYHAVRLWPLLDPDPYEGPEAALVADLEALPDDAWAVSDDPGFLWRLGIQTPPDAVDPSSLRILTGRLDAGTVVSPEWATHPRVSAVVVWSNRFADLPNLPERLTGAGYEVTASYGNDRELWTRESCRS